MWPRQSLLAAPESLRVQLGSGTRSCPSEHGPSQRLASSFGTAARFHLYTWKRYRRIDPLPEIGPHDVLNGVQARPGYRLGRGSSNSAFEQNYRTWTIPRRSFGSLLRHRLASGRWTGCEQHLDG